MRYKGEKKREATSFGKAVLKKLVDRNMTQTELARQLGIDFHIINDIILGRRPGKKHIAKIAEHLGIDANRYDVA